MVDEIFEETEGYEKFYEFCTRAEQIFGDKELASRWIEEKNSELGGMAPLYMLNTQANFDEAMELLDHTEQVMRDFDSPGRIIH